jgi:hypothetical protein
LQGSVLDRRRKIEIVREKAGQQEYAQEDE